MGKRPALVGRQTLAVPIYIGIRERKPAGAIIPSRTPPKACTPRRTATPDRRESTPRSFTVHAINSKYNATVASSMAILGCSKRKDRFVKPLPALDRYDEPAFRRDEPKNLEAICSVFTRLPFTVPGCGRHSSREGQARRPPVSNRTALWWSPEGAKITSTPGTIRGNKYG